MALQEEFKEQGNFLFKYRSWLPLILLVFGLWVKIYQEKYIGEDNETVLVEMLETISIFVGLFGFFIRVLTVGYTPKNTSGRNSEEGQIADELNTTGLYSLMRNPLYLGNYFMWLAIAMLTGNVWFVLVFSLVFWIYYERIVYAEESFLRTSFGKTYLDWAAKTPVFLPKHLKYVKPSISFSWKKVLRQEKNGLFALFLVFLIFESVGEYVEDGSLIAEDSWILIGAISTGILYIILKILKKFTNVLKEEGR